MRRHQIRFTAVLLALFLGGPPSVGPRSCWAQQDAVAQPEQADSFADLRQRVSDAELADEEKKPILDSIGKAETLSNEATTLKDSAAQSQASLASIKARVDRAKMELDSLNEFKPKPTPLQTLPELEALLLNLDGELASAKAAAIEAEALATRVPNRRREIETLLPELDSQTAANRVQIDAAAADPGTSLALQAKRLVLASTEQLLQTKADALRNEATLIDAESAANFHQLNRDLKNRIVETKQQQRDLVDKAVEAARAKDAAQRVESAEAQMASLHPALLPIGQRNRELAELNQLMTAQIAEVDVTLLSRTAKLEELRASFQQTKTRVETIGLTDAVGSMLRNLKQTLPRPNVYRLRSQERQPLINDAQYTLIDYTDERNASLDAAIVMLVSDADPPVPYSERSKLAEDAKTLLATQRTEYLDPVISSQTTYFNTLVSLSATEQQIVQLVDEATAYVNERVLWIRSSTPLFSQLAPEKEERWILDASIWRIAANQLVADIWQNLFLWSSAIAALIGLIRFRFRLRSEIREIGHAVSKSSHTAFAPTVQSLLLTVATAAPLPLIFGFLAWRSSGVAGSDRALLALAAGCQSFAMLFFPIELLRQVCRGDGLAVSHFGWHAASCNRLRRWLRPLLFSFVPLIVLTSMLAGGRLGIRSDTLERYFFIVALGLVAFFVAKFLHPRDGLPGNYLRFHADGWAGRLSYLWYPIVVAGPIAMIVLTVLGYYFTSQQLTWRVFVTLCLLLFIVLTGAMGSRWMLLNRRKLRIDQARRERVATTPTIADEIPIEPQEATAEELQSQMQQTRRLVKTVMFAVALIGMWFIWSDVLTSRRISEDWWVWQSISTVSETVTSEAGEPITMTRDVIEKITVADIFMAFVILMVTFLATRNIPGLLEFALLQRLPLDNSIRYAITSLASYAIALVGLVVTGNAIGLHWNQIQWMATALTFGLAFGLQEVFANFVAGIIILFEQPVRVGDVVEIDGVTGVVSKIRIRATTITDWNRRDFIVPNKEFITGKVLNWTRSDEVNRAVINVGVAYGSDTDRVRELLLSVAHAHCDVLDDPGPLATFEGFGDNSLNFVLRAFIRDLSKRLSTIHDLHSEINKTFTKAGIEISFPQRDLHVRSVAEPLLSYLKQPKTKPTLTK